MSVLQPMFITSLLLSLPAFHTQQVLTTNLDSLRSPATTAPDQLYSTSRDPEPSFSIAVKLLTEPGPESSTSRQYLEPSTAPTIQPITESVLESSTTATAQPTTKPVPESSTSPTIQPATESVPESSATPTVQPATESVPESSSSPTIQPTTESVPESSSSPTTEPITESVPESSSSPTIQPTTESVPELSATLIVQPTTETVPESSIFPTTQPTTEPVQESSTIPTVQLTTEPLPESSNTPTAHPTTESVPELSTVPIIQPTTELISEISSTPTAQTTAEAILGKTIPQPVQHTQGNTLTIIGKPSTLRPALLPESSTLETSSFKATVTQTVLKSTSPNIVPLEAKVGVSKTGMLWKTIVIAVIMMAGIATIACVLWGVSTTSNSKRKRDGEWDACGGDGGADESLGGAVRDESGSPGLMLVSFISKDLGVGAAGTKEARRWNEVEALLFIDEDSS